MQKKSKVLHEGYVQGLRKALSVLNEELEAASVQDYDKEQAGKVKNAFYCIDSRLHSNTGWVDVEKDGDVFVIKARTNFEDGDDRYTFVAEPNKGITLVSIENTFMYRDSVKKQYNSLCPIGTEEFAACMRHCRRIHEIQRQYIGRLMQGNGVEEFFEVFDGE